MSIRILMNEPTTFDKVVHGGLTEGGDLTFVTKDNATEHGHPAVCVTFTVQLPNGTPHRAQAVVTARNLIDALHAIMGRYSYLANATEPEGEVGEQITSSYQGIGYDALRVESVWLVSIENTQALGIARSKDDVKAVAEGLILALGDGVNE